MQQTPRTTCSRAAAAAGEEAARRSLARLLEARGQALLDAGELSPRTGRSILSTTAKAIFVESGECFGKPQLSRPEWTGPRRV
jgi:hypothetical protein